VFGCDWFAAPKAVAKLSLGLFRSPRRSSPKLDGRDNIEKNYDGQDFNVIFIPPPTLSECRYSRRQLFANAAMAASRVAVLTRGGESAHEPAASNGFIPQHRPQHRVWVTGSCARVRFL
jgi:hypothetical protein